MIFYASIARAFDGVILAESKHPSTGGNGDEIMRALMVRLVEIPEAIPPSTGKTFSQRNSRGEGTGDFFADLLSCAGGFALMNDGDNNERDDHFFHVWYYDGVYYACISDDDDNRAQQVNFDFLKEVQTDFKKNHNAKRIAQANELGFNEKWLPRIRSKFHYYNTNHVELRRGKNVQKIMNEIEDMKTVLNKNIQLVLKLQENQLTTMLRQSDEMSEDIKMFKKRSTAVRREVEMQRCIQYSFFAFCFIFIFYLLLSAFCGFNFRACRVDGNNKN